MRNKVKEVRILKNKGNMLLYKTNKFVNVVAATYNVCVIKLSFFLE